VTKAAVFDIARVAFKRIFSLQLAPKNCAASAIPF